MPRAKKPKKEKIIQSEPTELKPTGSKAVENVYVYRGGLPRISINKKLYEWGVPSLMRKEIYNTINKDEFEQYDQAGNNFRPSTIPIAVYLPNDIRYVVGCMTTIHRIKQCYPTCAIVTYGREEHKELLPSFCQYQTGRTGRERFYRTFDFQESALKQYWLKPSNEIFQPIHLLVLRSSGLFNIGQDEALPVVYSDRERKKYGGYTLHTDGSEFSETVKNEINDFQLIDPKTVDSTSRGVVFTYDTPLLYYYLYLGIPALVFINNTAHKHQFQYKIYDGVTIWQVPKPEDYKSAMDIIGKFVGNQVPKWTKKEKIIEPEPVIEEFDITEDREGYPAYGYDSTDRE